MSETFSEVALTFNAHLANLNEARIRFQDEIQRFQSEVVTSRLNDLPGTPVGPYRKLRWRRHRETSKQREISWTNWAASTSIEVDVLLPGMRNFKRGVGILYFETTFDRNHGCFRFRGRFENQNIVSEQLDEAIIEAIRVTPEAFPEHDHIKANTALLFKLDIDQELENAAVRGMEASLEAVRTAVDIVFPDELYATAYSDDSTGEEATSGAAESSAAPLSGPSGDESAFDDL